jgi:ribosome-associated translation inhibitor RaiA
MNIEVRSRDAEMSAEARDHAAEKIGHALGRFRDHITSVKVALHDANGPKGGVDKVGRVVVRGREAWSVVVSEEADDPRALADALSARAAESVRRVLARRRGHEKIPLSSLDLLEAPIAAVA